MSAFLEELAINGMKRREERGKRGDGREERGYFLVYFWLEIYFQFTPNYNAIFANFLTYYPYYKQ